MARMRSSGLFSQQVRTMIDELEWQTRRDRINKKLRALKPAWKIVKYSDKLDTSKLDRHAVEEYPTGKGPADLVLPVVD